MAEVSHGMRAILKVPQIYNLYQALIGKSSLYSTLIQEYVRPEQGDRILEIGCGLGDLNLYLPPVEYLGFDADPNYIRSAREHFGDRATFVCERVSTKTLKQKNHFDIVIAFGLLHHLNDREALQVFELAAAALKPGGRLITFDGCFLENQSPIARYILSKDRGQNVRTPKGYLAIAAQIFSKITFNIRSDLLRIPYDSIILECTLERESLTLT